MEEFPGCGAADYAEDCQRLSGRSGVPRSEVTISESAGVSNMWILACLAAVGGGLLLRSAYERKTLTTTEYTVETDLIRTDRTYVFLSDLHDNCFGEGQKELLAAIEAAYPDAVLIGGDMMVVKHRADIDAALFLVEKLAKRYPVYHGNGNHENRMDRDRGVYLDQYDRYTRRLRELGVHHLSDSAEKLEEDIWIHGLNLDKQFYKKFHTEPLEAAYIRDKLGEPKTGSFHILLAHSPLYQKVYGEWGADLTLCGHFHGGTIRIPGLGGLMTPQFQFFKDCCGGIFQNNGRMMIVSRGLGTHSVNIRLNNKPELVVIRLKAKD